MRFFCGFVGQEAAVDDEQDPAEEALLKEFHMVFAEPAQLPLVRNLDHKIPLFTGAKSVNIRPYRSCFIHKEEIDRLVTKMLKNGTIQHSSIPFASPILLVKLKDNTWRFCIDYRQLNSLSVSCWMNFMDHSSSLSWIKVRIPSSENF